MTKEIKESWQFLKGTNQECKITHPTAGKSWDVWSESDLDVFFHDFNLKEAYRKWKVK